VDSSPEPLVEHFFRHETGRLHAVLLRLLGTHRWQLAEDLAQESIMRAMRRWSMGGIPPNPSAWITRTAKNLALDALRREQMSSRKEASIALHEEQVRPSPPSPAIAWEVSEEIADDVLRLLFVCAHPEISRDAQVMLALKVICGFSTGEIARAFFSSEAAIEKRLSRTKAFISQADLPFELPSGAELTPRLEAVLETLYLLFNEGYKATSGEHLLREDLCHEAIRLAHLLTQHPVGNRPTGHALLALMLFNAARFETRIDETGHFLRLSEQDRSRWDQALIDQGLRHLDRSMQAESITAYHLQAAIASLHCLAPSVEATPWAQIVAYYTSLQRLHPSPVVLLNRAVAVGYAEGPAAGLDALRKLREFADQTDDHLYHAVEADFLVQLGQTAKSHDCFCRAARLARTESERSYLTRRAETVSTT
jgi:RNA polymerase sigma-70 factor (ECF subfamily)